MDNRDVATEDPPVIRRREHPLHEATVAMSDAESFEKVKSFQNDSIVKMAQMSTKLAAFNRMSEVCFCYYFFLIIL